MFDHPEEFVVLLLNFYGSGEAPTRERVLSCLLTRIKEASEEIVGGDVGDAFPLVPPPCHKS